jgi:hypothetical protein
MGSGVLPLAIATRSSKGSLVRAIEDGCVNRWGVFGFVAACDVLQGGDQADRAISTS